MAGSLQRSNVGTGCFIQCICALSFCVAIQIAVEEPGGLSWILPAVNDKWYYMVNAIGVLEISVAGSISCKFVSHVRLQVQPKFFSQRFGSYLTCNVDSENNLECNYSSRMH